MDEDCAITVHCGSDAGDVELSRTSPEPPKGFAVWVRAQPLRVAAGPR